MTTARPMTAQERRWVQRLRRVLADQPDDLVLVLDYAAHEVIVIDSEQHLAEVEAIGCDALATVELRAQMEVAL